MEGSTSGGRIGLDSNQETACSREQQQQEPALAEEPQQQQQQQPADTRDLWVVVKGAPSVQPHQVDCEVKDFAHSSSDGDEEEGEEGTGCSTGCSPGGAYVAVDREDVVEAVADFVKGRMVSHMAGHNYEPKDVAAAVDVAFADEKKDGWRRVWGKGRFLYRSATVMGGIVDELGPSGRTGMALRGASSKALGFMGAKKPNDPTCPS